MADRQTISFEIHYDDQFVNFYAKTYINDVIGFIYEFDIDHLSFFGLQYTLTSDFSLEKRLPYFFLLESTLHDGLIELQNDDDISCIEDIEDLGVFNYSPKAKKIYIGCDNFF
jgi:hypothetical protein